jgi:hypothetical protein
MTDGKNEATNNMPDFEEPQETDKQNIPEPQPKTYVTSKFIGTYLLLLSSLLAYLIFVFWPEFEIKDGVRIINEKYYIFQCQFSIRGESRILLLVMLTGALGSFIHAATSFVSFVGNRRLILSWRWWYVLRPFIGMALAVIFYCVIRGGFLSVGADTAEINYFGIAAVSGLVGMFSKNASDKLREVFDNLFKVERGDKDRKDKLENDLPVTERMLAANKIIFVTLEEPEHENDVPESHVSIQQLWDLLNGSITRIPIIDHHRAVKYVIHQSLLYKYIAKLSVSKTDPPNLNQLTLTDFLKVNNNEVMVSKSLSFVAREATIGDAKKQMESNPLCQDVFITESGKSTEEVIGWLTNVDISKHIDL